VEFYGKVNPLPHPFVKSTAPAGVEVRRSSLISIELADYVAQTTPSSVKLLVNGQTVTPTVTRPAGTNVITTINYDAPAPLPVGTNAVTVIFGDTSSPTYRQTNSFSFVVISDDQQRVTPDMLFGSTTFFATPAGLDFASPVPFGIPNNENDNGWIWLTNSFMYVDFGAPIALSNFRVYATFPGSGRGAVWTIESSSDNVTYNVSTNFTYETGLGAGLNQDGTPRTDDYAGWYGTAFNSAGVSARYWRVRESDITLTHAPRSGQVEFYGQPTASPLPVVKSAAPTGQKVQPDAVVKIHLQDNITKVAPGSIQLLVNGTAVTPSVNKEPGSLVTTVAYDSQGKLPNGTNSVRVIFSDYSAPPVFQTNDYTFVVQSSLAAASRLLTVTPSMLSGSVGTFFATPGSVGFAQPIPYGFSNNTNDTGWIWDNGKFLTVDFGVPTILTEFRIYVSYAGGGRGATWAIESSNDDTNWTKATDFDFRSVVGGGVNDDGTARADYGGWYQSNFNNAGVSGRYWRLTQTAVTVSHAPRGAQVEFYGVPAPVLLSVSPDMLSGPLTFFASPAGLKFANPIPYGIVNNTNDQGWIWPTDNSGNLVVDFKIPTVLTKFRIYVTYVGSARGANWAIEYSDDGSNWTKSADFDYRSSAGGGINDDGTGRTDFGGWYQTIFNDEGVGARYWRIRQTAVTVTHAPRSGQVEFYEPGPPEPVVVFRADNANIAVDATGNVTLWPDEAGSPDNAILVSTNNGPTRATAMVNGVAKPVIHFDGTQILESPVRQTPLGSLFIVMKTSDATVGNQRVIGWEDSDTGHNGLGLSPQLAGGLFAIMRNQGAGGDILDSNKPNVDYEIVTVTWGSAGTSLHRNGVLVATKPTPPKLSADPNVKALRIGGPGSGGSPRFRGDILELRVYDEQLAGDAQAEVEAELHSRWFAQTGLGSISITRSGNNVVISWTGTASFQTADSVNGNWTTVPGATSPQTVTPQGLHKFYRLKQ